MTKKDYERAALIVQRFRNHANADVTFGAVQGFVELFASDNLRFDETRFRAACVPGANVKARPRKVCDAATSEPR